MAESCKAGKLDIGEGSQTPASAMSLSEEITMLRKRVKEQDKEIRRLKEENEFLEEASAFFRRQPSEVSKNQRMIFWLENRGRQDYRKNLILLPDAWYQPARFL